MPWKPKAKLSIQLGGGKKVRARVTVIKCGRCGKSYSNPLTHTCMIRSGYKRQAGSRRRK